MKTLEFSYAMEIEFSEPAVRHCFSLRCLPFDSPSQNIREMFVDISPHNVLTETTDGFGNRVLTDRITQMHDKFSVYVVGTAEVDNQKKEKEPLNGIYKYPSQYTKCGEKLLKTAEHLKEKIEGLSVHEAAKVISDEIRAHFSYQSGATNIQTTAEAAYVLGKGVCQDYAHIFIALCRQLGIPARYVVGIPQGEGETHAWAEVYDDGIWFGVDPTNNCFVDDSYILLSRGRDFADCSVNRGVLIGGGTQKQKIKATVKIVEPKSQNNYISSEKA